MQEVYERLLDSINGVDGIATTIGRIPHTRGAPVEHTPACRKFDIFAKVFAKAPEPLMYNAVIFVPQSGNLYFSYPGNNNLRSLFPTQINALFESLKILKSNPTTDNKINLFILMYQFENDLLMEHLLNLRQEELKKYKKQEPNIFKFIDKIKPGLPIDELSIIIAGNKSKIEEIFNAIISDDELGMIDTEILNSVPILVEPHKDSSHPYYAVHVEDKGIHYARLHESACHAISIGLARRDNKTPGCCSCCVAALDATEQVTKITFGYTYKFPHNFPPGPYKTSPNVVEDPRILQIFANNIKNLWQEIFNDHQSDSRFHDVQQHDFFVALGELPSKIT